jgi:hypothetical protein
MSTATTIVKATLAVCVPDGEGGAAWSFFEQRAKERRARADQLARDAGALRLEATAMVKRSNYMLAEASLLRSQADADAKESDARLAACFGSTS